MLGLRTRSHHLGAGSAPLAANAAATWGDSNVGKNGGGYESQSYFPYPQGVPGLSDLTFIAMGTSDALFIKKDGSLWVAGNNSGIGSAGNGLNQYNVLTPQKIVGGVPLYRAESIAYAKEGGGTWLQPQGPIGPVLPPIVAGTNGSGACNWILTNDGRALASGSASEGQLGNGHVQAVDQVGYEKGFPPTSLTVALSTTGTTSVLHVPALENSIAAGSRYHVKSGGHGQLLVVSALAKAKATEVQVEPVKANFAYPIGSVFKPIPEWPQWAYWWVQKAGPSLVPAGSERLDGGTYSSAEAAAIKVEAEAQILTGIRAIAGAEKCCFYLMENGQVRITGQAGGSSIEHFYADVDPVWEEVRGSVAAPIAIAASHGGYLLLLADGTVFEVGVPIKNAEEGVETAVRIWRDTGLSKVTAIARGEYFWMALKDNGKITVFGSNVEGQLGLGREPGEPAYSPVELTSLSNVTAIHAGAVRRGNGANNGDVAMALLSDGTIRTWGSNYTTGTAAGIKYLPWGVLGDGTSENRNAPVQPAIANVKFITCSTVTMGVIQEPALPPLPSISVQVVGKTVVVTWVPVTLNAGTLPRAPEGWKVKIRREVEGKEVLVVPEAKLGPGITSYTSPTLPAGILRVIVEEEATVQQPSITGGASKKATAGVATVAWSAPAKPARRLIVEIRRTSTFLKGAKVEREDWKRIRPEALGTDISMTFNLPAPTHTFTAGPGGVGSPDPEAYEVQVTEAPDHSYDKRIVQVTV